MKILCGLVENVCENTRKVDYVMPETNYSWDKCFVAWCSLLLVTQCNRGVFRTQSQTLQWSFFAQKVNCFAGVYFLWSCRFDPAGIYLFKVNDANIGCKICSKLKMKTPERRDWRCSGVFLVNFEQLFINFSGLSVFDFEQVNVGWVELGQAFSYRKG